MELTDLENEVEKHVLTSRTTEPLTTLILQDQLQVIKYMPADYLWDVVTYQHLYATERAGFTWGDAIYVAPVAYPRTTMMYGEVGVVGIYRTTNARFFNAVDPAGIRLYQKWIAYQTGPYLELTTTVHANLANRELRNAFRTRFQVDCVYFRPDESCLDYVDVTSDLWLAITHWDAYRSIGHGFSKTIENLRWCVVTPDAFKADDRGYKAFLHKTLSASHGYCAGHYSTLATDVKKAYDAGKQVVICDFV